MLTTADVRARFIYRALALIGLITLVALPASAAGTFQQEAKIVDPNGKAGDYLASSATSINSIDGNTLSTGAGWADKAFVFVRSGTTWSPQQELTGSDTVAGDRFGIATALDGNTLVVGADGYPSRHGAVYVFVRSGTTWTQQAKLTASDSTSGALFGSSIDFEGDTLIVGAMWRSGSAHQSGAAYVFARSGTTWTQQAKLISPNPTYLEWFGADVAVSGDTALVGSRFGNGPYPSSTGSADVFVRSGTTWTHQAELVPWTAGRQMGSTVALDGDTAVGGDWSGSAAYVFLRSGTTWTGQQRISGPSGRNFGQDVAIQGERIVVGHVWGTATVSGAGAVHVYDRPGTTWTLTQTLGASDAVYGDILGDCVALSGNTIISGIRGLNRPDPNRGALYVWRQGGVAPTADAGSNVAIDSEDQSTTTITGTVGDADGDTLTCRWLEGTTVLKGPTTVTGTSYPLALGSLSTLSVGDHTLTLEVSDGTHTVTDAMTLTVANSAPTAAPSGAGCYEYGTGNTVTLDGDVADFDGDTLTYEWRVAGSTSTLASGTRTTTAGGTPAALPSATVGTTTLGLGTHTVELAVDDGVNDEIVASIEVEVKDTTAPTLALDCSKTILWPPNHEMVAVTVDPNAADEGGAVTITASVVSSEPVSGTGDGDTSPDWAVVSIDATTGVVSLDLRAERSGSGSGRVYTVTITASDGSGNSSSATCQVVVPKSKGKNK